MLLAGEVTQGCVVNAPKDGAHLLLIHDVINKHGSQLETCWDDDDRVQASALGRELPHSPGIDNPVIQYTSECNNKLNVKFTSASMRVHELLLLSFYT